MVIFIVTDAGQGVFTAKDITRGSKLDSSYSLILDDYMTQELSLINYVYQSPNIYHAVILFGNALLVNHQPEEFSNIEREWLVDADPAPLMPSNALRPYTIYPSMTFTAKRDIKAGEELFVTYGSDDYFAERFTTSQYGRSDSVFEPRKFQYDVNELLNKGSDLRSIHINESSVAMAGKGAFSKVKHEKGSRVALSPALAVPKHFFMEAGRECVLINYCLSAEDTDIALLPLGLPAMINHGGQSRSNVAIRWFDWMGRDITDILGNMDGDITGFAGKPVYLEYYATKPIRKGEELFLDYGLKWEKEWYEYEKYMSSWMIKEDAEQTSLSLAPQFRYPISVPGNFFPEVLRKKCVGTSDCSSPEKKRRPDMVNSRLNKEGQRHLMDLETISAAEKYLFDASSPQTIVSTAGEVKAENVDILDQSSLPCGMYLAPILSGSESIKQSTGVFSGVPIRKGTPVEGSITILLRKELKMRNKLLREYTAASGRVNYGMAYLGAGAHMREGMEPNIGRSFQAKEKELIPIPSRQALRPYSVYDNVVHYSDKDIRAGSELIIFEGSDSDAEKLKSPIKSLPGSRKASKYTLSQLQDVGHCMTHIYVEPSNIPLGANGVYTESGYNKGETVSISIALILPKHLLLEDESSVLINYCISSETSDVAMLPLGQAGMMNHGGTAKSNIAIKFFDWNNNSVEDYFDIREKSGVAFDAAPVYIEYYATRSIGRGEELLLDYGVKWEAAWRRYLHRIKSWIEVKGNKGESLVNAPQFREPISAPSGLFPTVFQKQKCFGSLLCTGNGLRKSSRYINAKLSFKNATALGAPARLPNVKPMETTAPSTKRAKVSYEPLSTSKEIPRSNMITKPNKVDANSESSIFDFFNAVAAMLF